MTQLLITAVGPDRPGLVGDLTGHLHASGANLLDSRMVNLRGQFAIVMLLECPDEDAARLGADLPNFGDSLGLKLSVVPQSARRAGVQGIPYRLKTYSLDQPGILARLTRILRDHGVNIEDLSARQESAAFAGSPLFLTEMRLTVPASVPLGKLRADLEAIGNELNCDVDLDPAES